MDFRINLDQLSDRKVKVQLRWGANEGPKTWRLPALQVQEGLRIVELHGLGPGEKKVGVKTESDRIIVPKFCFGISYELYVELDFLAGAHIDHPVHFPFLSLDGEFYFSSGCLPYPEGLSARNREEEIRFRLEGLPPGLTVFTSLLKEGIEGSFLLEKLPDFFLYLTHAEEIKEHVFDTGQGHELKVRYLEAHWLKKRIGAGPVFSYLNGYFAFLAREYGAYQKTDWLNILVAPAASDAAAKLNGHVMAGGGFNCLNGVGIHAPEDSSFTGRVFGYPDYADFIHDGLTHEIGHLYTSSGWGRAKSILYASEECSIRLRSLVGESLNGYLHQLYMKTIYSGSIELFFSESVTQWLERFEAGKRRNSWLDWLLVDIYLQKEHGFSVPKLFRELVQDKLSDPTPFSHGDWLWKILSRKGVELPEKFRKILLGPETPDYLALVPEGLKKLRKTSNFQFP